MKRTGKSNRSGACARPGDRGDTRVPAGGKVRKSDPRIEALGEIDELNCVLGLLALFLGDSDRGAVGRIQRELFSAGADVSAAGRSCRLSPGTVKALDEAISRMSARLPRPSGFVVPGGTGPAAWCHLARAVARRAERRVAALPQGGLNPEVPRYLNRLSSFLFVLARALAARKSRPFRP